MTKSQDSSISDKYDTFIANTVYPDAAAIFQTQVQSLDTLKESCLVVLDTNVLLLPYSVRQESLERIEATYRYLLSANRLFVPGQVAREFANNRAAKLGDLFHQLNLKSGVQNLQKGKYPLLESMQEYQELVRLEQEIDRRLSEYREVVKVVANRIRQWRWNDPVSQIYATLFDSRVVVDIDIDRDAVIAELKRRQAHHLPPGYKDANKEDGGIGDLLIWMTVCELGMKLQKSVLFVTGDEKPDWYHQGSKQALFPRFELVDEFRRVSNGNSFHIVPFSGLLDLFNANTETVQEVKRQEAQQRTLRFQFLSGVEQSVFEWLQTKYPNALIDRGSSHHAVDFFLLDDTLGLVGVTVKHFGGDRERTNIFLSQVLGRWTSRPPSSEFDSQMLVLVFNDINHAEIVLGKLWSFPSTKPSTQYVIGCLSSEGAFVELSTN